MRYSERLKQSYIDEIQLWNWNNIDLEVHENPHADECGDIVGSALIGEVTSIFPSGKIYAMWTTNQTIRDMIKDQAFSEALEAVTEEHGFNVEYVDDCVFISLCLDPGGDCFFTENGSDFIRNGETVAESPIALRELMDSEGCFPNVYQLDSRGDLLGFFDLDAECVELQLKIDKIVEYAWPGGYPVIYIVKYDCSTLCAECTRKELKSGNAKSDQVIPDVYYEGPSIFCDECNVEIESAYGDPEEDNEVVS